MCKDYLFTIRHREAERGNEGDEIEKNVCMTVFVNVACMTNIGEK